MRWFELPTKYSIDIERIKIELQNLNWIQYGEATGTPGKNAYHGIGLTCRKNSPTPELDALQVFQEIRMDIVPNSHHFNWQEMDQLTSVAQGYIQNALFCLGLSPGKARFGKLNRNSRIPVHRDDYCENICRVHWPIETDENNFFVFHANDLQPVETLNMHLGKGYAIDPDLPHSFINKSQKVDRIHLIVNINMNLQSLFQFLHTQEE